MNNNDKIAQATKLTPEQVGVIKNTVAKGTTDTELAYFLMTAQQVGLSPFTKEVWCYKDGKGNQIIFAGRDGFLKIAQRDQRWNGITSSEVRENDEFSLDIPQGIVHHKITNMRERGKIIGAYAYVKPKGVDTATIEWVDFETYDKGYNVWKTHPADMIKKVAETRVLKKAFGISGLASEYEFEVKGEKVLAIDTETKPTDSDLNYIESLIRTSSLNSDEREMLENNLYDMGWNEYETAKNYLLQNQTDPMERTNYNQGDINDKLDKIMSDDTK